MRRAPIIALLVALVQVWEVGAKVKWGSPNPNPGWDKYYAGKCDEFLRCSEDGDNECLEKTGIPLCNLEVQQTGIPIPWQRGLGLAAANGQLSTVQLFIRSPLKWWDKDDLVNEAEETVLMHAAANGEHKVVRWLLEEGSDVRRRSREGETAMDIAVTSENPDKTAGVISDFAAMATEHLQRALRTNKGATPELIEKCLRAGASLSQVDPESQTTALGMAVKNGLVDAVAKLTAEGAPLSHRNPRTGHDILHTACDTGNYHITDLLIKAGADVNALTTQFNMNCLHLAAMNGRNGIALLAIEAGADVNAVDWQGDTALLHYARQMFGSSASQGSVVKKLADAGASADTRDVNGHSALYYAVTNNQLSAVTAMVSAGATASEVSVSQDRDGSTRVIGAFQQAVHSGSREVALWLVQNGHREPFDRVSLSGTADSRGRTMTGLYAVVHQGWTQVAVEMLKLPSAPQEANSQNTDGSTPLFAAAYRGDLEVVKGLIKVGAQVDRRNRLKETPLFLAAYMGDASVASALIAAGADVNAADVRGQTPLFRTAQRGTSAVALVLLQAGASNTHKAQATESQGARTFATTMETPAECADRHGFKELASLIRNFKRSEL